MKQLLERAIKKILPIPFLSLLCCFLFMPSANAQFTPWEELLFDNGHLVIETEVDGVRGFSIVDTGAQMTGINIRFLRSIEPSFREGGVVQVRGLFGVSNRRSHSEIPVTVLGVETEFNGAVEMNLGPPGLQLLLGANFLDALVFQFDYPNRRMRAIARENLNLKKIRNVKAKRDPSGGSPIVRVRLNDEKNTWLTLDTGNSGGIVLDRKIATKLKWLERYPTVESVSAGVITAGRMEEFTLPSMTFGDYVVVNPLISVPGANEDTELFKKESHTYSRIERGRQQAEGLLGYDVLRNFIVTIDYKKGYVHIEPGSPEQE